MAVQDTINLLQTLNASIQGVVAAPQLADYPTSVNTFNLPLVITWPTRGEWYSKGGGAKQSTRTYEVICYVQPIAQNDIPSNLVLSTPLLQRFLDAYIDVQNIPQSTPPQYQITIESSPNGTHHTDDGIRSDLMFGGTAYHGFILHVQVREYWL